MFFINKNISFRHIIYTFSPVNHGGVTGVHVDANAITRFGISSTADSMQTLKRGEGRK